MTKAKHIKIGNVTIGNDLPFTLIAGPCQMESREHALEMAESLINITKKLNIPLIYKSSFDKANRTSLGTKRGIGLEKSLSIFAEIKEKFGCPVLTDVHNEAQCAEVAGVVDVLQIPAFLCRQTDLLIAAAKTGKVINVKKGQFLAPWDMKNVAAKVSESGNDNIILTDRGTCFGYNTLISDMRGLHTMAETGYPVVIDATHSIQQPGGMGGVSGGQRHFVPVIARAAIAVGVAGIFMETHQDPDNAPSDGPCMVVLNDMDGLLQRLAAIDKVIKAN
jgi:2-dehydro-3-deoxyphosphooctonate aldolase (KDO 8-P synthase)